MAMNENKVMKLGKILKETRKEQKLTQLQLAGYSGVGVRFVRELENGKQSCHIGKAIQIVSMLGIDIHLNGKKL